MKIGKSLLFLVLISYTLLCLSFSMAETMSMPDKELTKKRSGYQQGRFIVKFEKDVSEEKAKNNIINIIKPISRREVRKINIKKRKINIKKRKINIKKLYPNISKKQFPYRDIRRPKNRKIDCTNPNTFVVDFDKDIDVRVLVNIILRNPKVVYAQPDYYMTLYMIPNDPYYDSSDSWGQDYDDLWAIKKINCENAWDISTGTDIVVAIIDSGVDYNHEDLAENIWINAGEDINGNGIADESDFNSKDDDGNGYIDDIRGWDFHNNDNDPMDDYGHGTHCAGIIAAIGNNNKGIIGVAPDSRIMCLKAFGAEKEGNSSNCANAIKYAVENGADIIFCPWGAPGENSEITNSIEDAYSKGCVCIAAVGNDNVDSSNIYPASLNEVIAVASSDINDVKSAFSNYSPKIDITAPGGGGEIINNDKPYCDSNKNILSLKSLINSMDPFYLVNICNYNMDDKYYRAKGTSMASSYVAGVAALVLEHYTDFTVEKVYSQIIENTDNIYNIPANQNYVNSLGAGRLNAYKAVTGTVLVPCLPDLVIEDAKLETVGATKYIYIHIVNQNPQVSVKPQSDKYPGLKYFYVSIAYLTDYPNAPESYWLSRPEGWVSGQAVNYGKYKDDFEEDGEVWIKFIKSYIPEGVNAIKCKVDCPGYVVEENEDNNIYYLQI